MDDSEVILLAHMIGDGSCVKRQPIRYASIDEANLAAVTIAAAHFGVTAVRDEYPAARVTTLRLPAPYRLTHGKRNPIAAWLDKLGLFGQRSYEKFVPQEVFALPNDQVALFLRHLWATDGSVRWDAKVKLGPDLLRSTSRQTCRRRGAAAAAPRCALRASPGPRRPVTAIAGIFDIDRRREPDAVPSPRRCARRTKCFAAREVLANLASRFGAGQISDTVPKEVWGSVQKLLADRR